MGRQTEGAPIFSTLATAGVTGVHAPALFNDERRVSVLRWCSSLMTQIFRRSFKLNSLLLIPRLKLCEMRLKKRIIHQFGVRTASASKCQRALHSYPYTTPKKVKSKQAEISPVRRIPRSWNHLHKRYILFRSNIWRLNQCKVAQPFIIHFLH